MFSKIVNFAKRTVKSAVKNFTSFVKGFVNHAETVAVLSFSAIGANLILSEIPFYASMPLWIEAPLIIPALSILVVGLLLKSAEIRHSERYKEFVF